MDELSQTAMFMVPLNNVLTGLAEMPQMFGAAMGTQLMRSRPRAGFAAQGASWARTPHHLILLESSTELQLLVVFHDFPSLVDNVYQDALSSREGSAAARAQDMLQVVNIVDVTHTHGIGEHPSAKR